MDKFDMAVIIARKMSYATSLMVEGARMRNKAEKRKHDRGFKMYLSLFRQFDDLTKKR